MEIKNETKDEGAAVSKRGKKAGIFSLILCLLIATVIWCYAEAQAKKKEIEEASKDNKTIIVEKNAAGGADAETVGNEP